jgi:uncharacterized protein (DUF1330 family)
MSSYFIAQIKIHDQEEYDKYLAGYDEVFARYQGKVIVVDDDPTILEGEWPYTRTVVIRFPNEIQVRRWYDSPEYQKLVQHRHKGSQADIIIAQGRE